MPLAKVVATIALPMGSKGVSRAVIKCTTQLTIVWVGNCDSLIIKVVIKKSGRHQAAAATEE